MRNISRCGHWVSEVRDGRAHCFELGLHLVDGDGVGELEAERGGAGEAHGEEREAVPRHVERAVELPVLWVLVEGGQLKTEHTLRRERIDVAKHVLVVLAEELGHVSTVGEDLSIPSGDDGEEMVSER